MENNETVMNEELNSKLKELYNDFSRRKDPEEWEKLINEINDDDTALKAILEFFMDSYYICRNVWLYLDERFKLQENEEELKKQYPADFIDYVVLNGIRYENNLPQEMFEPGIDGEQCDLYRSIYSKAMSVRFEELPAFIEHLDGLSEYHPYGEALKHYYVFNTTLSNDSLSEFKKIYEKYPNSLKIASDYAYSLIRNSSQEEALEILLKLKTIYPANYDVRYMIVRSYYEMNDYKNADEQLRRMIEIFGPNNELFEILDSAQNSLIEAEENYTKIMPEDMDNQLDLARNLYRIGKTTEAEEIFNRIMDDEVEYDKYYTLKAKILEGKEDFDGALKAYLKVIDYLNSKTDKNEDTVRNLAYQYVYAADCYNRLNEEEKALTYYDEAKDLQKDNYLIQIKAADAFKEHKRYLEAIDVYEHIAMNFTSQTEASRKLAVIYESMSRDQLSINHLNTVLDANNDDDFMHYLKMKILLRHRMYDDVKNYLAEYEQRESYDEIAVKIIKGLLKQYDEKDLKEAETIFREVIDLTKNEYYFEDLSYVYFHLAELLTDDYEHFKDLKEEINGFADAALSIDPDNLECISLKSWLLNKDNKYDESVEILSKALKDPRHDYYIEHNMADTLYLGYDDRFEEALNYYNMLPYYENNQTILIRMVYANRCIGAYDRAKELSEIMVKNFPDNLKGYTNMAIALAIEYKYDEALTYLDKGISLIKEDSYSQYVYDLYNEKIRILRRQSKPLEALKVIEELKERRPDANINKTKFDINCQFGLFDEAENVLKDYRKKKDKGYYNSQYNLYLYTKQYDKAQKYLEKYREKITEASYIEHHCFLDYLNLDYETRLNRFLKRLEKSPDEVYVLGNIVESYQKLGNFEKMKEYAYRSLETIERKLKNEHESEMLYRTKRIPLYAVLKEEEKLQEELEKIKNCPMCCHCAYHGCKDLAIYEIDICILKGEYEKALELCRKYQNIYCDEMDFVAQEKEALKELEK